MFTAKIQFSFHDAGHITNDLTWLVDPQVFKSFRQLSKTQKDIQIRFNRSFNADMPNLDDNVEIDFNVFRNVRMFKIGVCVVIGVFFVKKSET